MRYNELKIETRREAPARARSRGEAFLIRAAYLASQGDLTGLGQRAINRLAARHDSLFRILSSAGLGPLQIDDHEIAVPIPWGEVDVLKCPSCGYAEEAELAAARKAPLPAEGALPLRKVETPHCDTIELLAEFLKVPKEQTAKAMMYTRQADGKFVFVVIRGDMQVSQAKLDKLVGPSLPASREEIIKAGAAPGYASPIGLREALIIVDDLIPQSLNLVVGANEPGYHLLNANYGRDFTAAIVQDVTLAQPNDPCPRCGSALEGAATTIVADRAGIHSRSVLTVFADKFQDDRGLCLPPLIAPFDVYLIQLASKNVDTRGPAGALYETLEASGLEVLYDDRDERAGVKFNDADLIGCPVRLTVGENGLRDGMVEFKRRSQTEIEAVKTSEATDHILKVLRDADA